MDEDKFGYRKGLLYFFCLMICIGSFFTTPDGDSLFYKLLGLFGISPGIRLGSNVTLYIYMLLPLIAAIVSGKKVLKYWQRYGLRFKDYHFLLRHLPVFVALPVFLVSSSIISPTGLDRIYYAVIGQRTGLQSVTYYAPDNNNNLSYEFTGARITYSYDLTFDNHSNETVEFNVKLVANNHGAFKETIVKDDNGVLKVFTLLPNQVESFRGEFTEFHQTAYDSGSGNGIFSVILLNNDEQFSPKPIIKRPS